MITLIIAMVIKKTVGIRISSEDEEHGIDVMLHSDPAYEPA